MGDTQLPIIVDNGTGVSFIVQNVMIASLLLDSLSKWDTRDPTSLNMVRRPQLKASLEHPLIANTSR
jgi:hypothetical protein